MDAKYIERILDLQKRKVSDENKKWYHFDMNHLINWIQWELSEVQDEIKQNNTIYLEDELADVFWTYTRLLCSLEIDGYIDIQQVFQRAEAKFRERVDAVENNISWDEIKKIQKEKREKEHNTLYQK